MEETFTVTIKATANSELGESITEETELVNDEDFQVEHFYDVWLRWLTTCQRQ